MASLLALSRATGEHSKRLLRWRLVAHGGTAGLGVLALLTDEPWTAALPILALITEGLAWWFRYSGREWHGRAEEARRYAVLMNGLGLQEEPIGAIDLRMTIGSRVENRAQEMEDSDYYATRAPAGPARLRDILVESAFWSKHLYCKAADRSFTVLAISVAGVIVLLLSTSALKGNPQDIVVSRIVILFLLFLIGIDELGQALEWRHAGVAVANLDRDLARLVTPSTEALLSVFAEYSVATATAVPIPTGMYEGNRERLNRLWAERQRK